MKKIFIIIFVCSLFFVSCTKEQARAVATWSNDLKQEYMIQNAKSRIQNYEWFYEQYEAIKSTASKVRLSEGSEKNSIRMVLADMISEYNARSRQTMTRANWKSESLPYQIEEKDFLEE